jgi:hypothetical protein
MPSPGVAAIQHGFAAEFLSESGVMGAEIARGRN